MAKKQPVRLLSKICLRFLAAACGDCDLRDVQRPAKFCVAVERLCHIARSESFAVQNVTKCLVGEEVELQPDSVDFCAAVYKIFYEEEKAAGLLVFYILIPCLVTSFSLMSYPDGHVERV